MRDHRRLKAFDLADEVALETYRLTKSFPQRKSLPESIWSRILSPLTPLPLKP